MSIVKIGNISALPTALHVTYASYFDGVTGDVLAPYQDHTQIPYLGNWYFLVDPASLPPPPGTTPLEQARAILATAKTALEAALATYVAIPSPTPADLAPVQAAELAVAKAEALVLLRSP